MRNVSETSCRENQKTFYAQKHFFFENRAVRGLMCKSVSESGRAHIKIWRMLFKRWVPEATNAHSRNM